MVLSCTKFLILKSQQDLVLLIKIWREQKHAFVGILAAKKALDAKLFPVSDPVHTIANITAGQWRARKKIFKALMHRNSPKIKRENWGKLAERNKEYPSAQTLYQKYFVLLQSYPFIHDWLESSCIIRAREGKETPQYFDLLSDERFLLNRIFDIQKGLVPQIPKQEIPNEADSEEKLPELKKLWADMLDQKKCLQKSLEQTRKLCNGVFARSISANFYSFILGYAGLTEATGLRVQAAVSEGKKVSDSYLSPSSWVIRNLAALCGILPTGNVEWANRFFAEMTDQLWRGYGERDDIIPETPKQMYSDAGQEEVRTRLLKPFLETFFHPQGDAALIGQAPKLNELIRNIPSPLLPKKQTNGK
ncbi:MAG: hypothetical protein M1549_00845 [Candidatus Dependentiae bacterium]|nr:hypothetical protein [Candidatus Dependentiae bacterium]